MRATMILLGWCAMLLTSAGCTGLQAPRPLSAGERYVCVPDSAIRQRAAANAPIFNARPAPALGTCTSP